MARKYSVKSKTCRWTLQVCFNILDLVGINVWVLYKETADENISGQEFLFQLASELGPAYKKSEQVKLLLASPTSSDSFKRKTCQIKFCESYESTKICSECEKYMCDICTLSALKSLSFLITGLFDGAR